MPVTYRYHHEKAGQVLGPTIRKAREAKGWSQARLAQVAGVSRKHISAMESGANVTIEVLRKVAEALDINSVQLPRLSMRFDAIREPDFVAAANALRRVDDILDQLNDVIAEAQGYILGWSEFTLLDKTTVVRDDSGGESTSAEISTGTLIPFTRHIKTTGGDDQFPIEKDEFIELDFDFPQSLHAYVVPVAAELAAGPPRDPDEILLPTAEILHSMHEITDHRLKVIKVLGDSMAPTLKNGWKILIDTKQKSWRRGQLVAAYVRNQGSTLGIFEPEGDAAVLRKLNPDYRAIPLPAGEWYPLGVVTRIVEASIEIE